MRTSTRTLRSVWSLLCLLTLLVGVPHPAEATSLGNLPAGWVPAPSPSGALVLAPTEEQAVANFLAARFGDDPEGNLASLLWDLGISRWDWEDNLALTTYVDLSAPSVNDMRGFFSLVEINAQSGFGCLFRVGLFVEMQCTAELSAGDLAAIPSSLGHVLAQTPEQFVDAVWPLGWEGRWWEDVPTHQIGASRWATSCHDLRLASPAAESAGWAAALGATVASAPVAQAVGAVAPVHAFFLAKFSSEAVLAGFIAASTGVTVGAVAATVGVAIIAGAVVGYAAYRSGRWTYAATFTGSCPGCNEMQADDYRCAVSNDTCECYETDPNEPYGPGDIDGATGADPNDHYDHDLEKIDPYEGIEQWEDVPFAGCTEWVTHYGSYCQLPCEQLAIATSEEAEEETEWTSCQECVQGTAGAVGRFAACVGFGPAEVTP